MAVVSRTPPEVVSSTSDTCAIRSALKQVKQERLGMPPGQQGKVVSIVFHPQVLLQVQRETNQLKCPMVSESTNKMQECLNARRQEKGKRRNMSSPGVLDRANEPFIPRSR